jgi:hypothetical protein
MMTSGAKAVVAEKSALRLTTEQEGSRKKDEDKDDEDEDGEEESEDDYVNGEHQQLGAGADPEEPSFQAPSTGRDDTAVLVFGDAVVCAGVGHADSAILTSSAFPGESMAQEQQEQQTALLANPGVVPHQALLGEEASGEGAAAAAAAAAEARLLGAPSSAARRGNGTDDGDVGSSSGGAHIRAAMTLGEFTAAAFAGCDSGAEAVAAMKAALHPVIAAAVVAGDAGTRDWAAVPVRG